MKKILTYFIVFEWCVLMFSFSLILTSFIVFNRVDYLVLIASFIGTLSLLFNAKGNPFGQFLTIVFSLFYGYISFKFAYYGEMITYLGMTSPIALLALISWIKNPSIIMCIST